MERTTFTLDDVLVSRQSDLGWLCEIAGRRTFIGKLQVPAGFQMPSEGQRGTIALTMMAAVDLGFVRAA
jgi:hypothetical protein